MRYLLIGLLLLCSCKRTVTTITTTVPIHDTLYRDTFYIKVVEYDTIVVGRNDSLIRRLNSSNLKLSRVRYYIGICDRNPTQDKFLRGWIKRAIK